MRKILARGAEAVITRDRDMVVKERVVKNYRLREIDERLKKQRTRREGKIMKTLPVPGPRVINVDDKNMSIKMEFLDGPKLSDVLEENDYRALSLEIGKKIRMLHEKGIIHGDLTTSNMLLLDEIYFIDFGLSFQSEKTEDKAVDLHLLRQALESRHHEIWEECFPYVMRGYDDSVVLRHLEKVEARGRNKTKSSQKSKADTKFL